MYPIFKGGGGGPGRKTANYIKSLFEVKTCVVENVSIIRARILGLG